MREAYLAQVPNDLAALSLFVVVRHFGAVLSFRGHRCEFVTFRVTVWRGRPWHDGRNLSISAVLVGVLP
jgi:hypothetical protein